MEKYRLIALDMDGTLLNSQLEVSPANREAVKRAQEAGKHVVLSTGRCLAELKESLSVMPGIRYLVCENGSCVYDMQQQRAIHLVPIPAQEILYILDLMRNEDVVLQAFHDNVAYFNQANGEWTCDFAVGNYREIFDSTAIWDELLFDTFESRPFQIEKLNIYCRDPQTQQRVRGILEGRNLKLAETMAYIVEITSIQADKGVGLQMLCKHIGVPIEQTIAVGDSMNDIEMLKTAGLSVAMGNACPEAKAEADVITDDCDHDGVAKVILEYLMK